MSDKRNYIELTEAAQAALNDRAEKYDVSVDVLYEVFNRGIVAWCEETNKTQEQYAFNRVDSFLTGGLASKLDKDLIENNKVLDNSGLELIEGKRVNNKTEYSVVSRDSSRVVKSYTQKHKSMHHTKKTPNHVHTMNDKKQVVKRKDFMGRSIDVKGHIVKEGASYLDARQKLHDAHHESSRILAGSERDPELRRLDLHRAKRHKHASRVIDILKTTASVSNKGKKKK